MKRDKNYIKRYATFLAALKQDMKLGDTEDDEEKEHEALNILQTYIAEGGFGVVTYDSVVAYQFNRTQDAHLIVDILGASNILWLKDENITTNRRIFTPEKLFSDIKDGEIGFGKGFFDFTRIKPIIPLLKVTDGVVLQVGNDRPLFIDLTESWGIKVLVAPRIYPDK